MKVSGAWLFHPGTQALMRGIAAAGHQILFVGGCVRNALMGVPVCDIDLATSATPDVVVQICEAAGLRVVPTGLDHGTVTVIASGRPHEVTTFRRDVATDGRRAVVAFTADLMLDAARRDFTMNALYATEDGTVLDPLRGLADVKSRLVRFAGDPQARIQEDYLRILRFFRFHAVYGDPDAGLDAEGLAACAMHADGLAQVSRERIGHEMRKLLAAADPAPAVGAMAHSGVLARIVPGADPRALAPLVHLEGAIAPSWLRRLATLGGADVAENLRLSRAESLDLVKLIEGVGAMSSPAVLGQTLGGILATDTLLVRAALLETPLPPGWQDDIARGASAVFPVTASDLMPDLAGAALGARLKDLERRWLGSDLRLSKADLLA
jgi:poly(A) polymerase